jgi:hypothetical protein
MNYIKRTAYQLAQRKERENSLPKANEKLEKTSEVFSSVTFSVASENMKIYRMLQLDVLLRMQQISSTVVEMISYNLLDYITVPGLKIGDSHRRSKILCLKRRALYLI